MAIFQPVSLEASLTLMPFFADGQGKLVAGDDGFQGFVGGRDGNDAFDAGRAQGRLGVGAGIGRPEDDVDFFPAEFLADGQDPASLGADAGADRVDVPFAAQDGDFRPFAGLADDVLDLDDARSDFGDFGLKKAVREIRGSSGRR